MSGSTTPTMRTLSGHGGAEFEAGATGHRNDADSAIEGVAPNDSREDAANPRTQPAAQLRGIAAALSGEPPAKKAKPLPPETEEYTPIVGPANSMARPWQSSKARTRLRTSVGWSFCPTPERV